VPQQPILICYDGSEDSRRAIAVAADLLSHRPAVLLDVTPPLTVEEEEAALLTPTIPDNVEQRVRDVRTIARRGVQLARAEGFEDAEERVVVDAPTWQGVVDVADEMDVSVIVVGSRGVSGLRELFEGSLSHDLLKHARRPLLIVPPEHDTVGP
jgi:nucleotide-binding universal stress UspA family protein